METRAAARKSHLTQTTIRGRVTTKYAEFRKEGFALPHGMGAAIPPFTLTTAENCHDPRQGPPTASVKAQATEHEEATADIRANLPNPSSEGKTHPTASRKTVRETPTRRRRVTRTLPLILITPTSVVAKLRLQQINNKAEEAEEGGSISRGRTGARATRTLPGLGGAPVTFRGVEMDGGGIKKTAAVSVDVSQYLNPDYEMAVKRGTENSYGFSGLTVGYLMGDSNNESEEEARGKSRNKVKIKAFPDRAELFRGGEEVQERGFLAHRDM